MEFTGTSYLEEFLKILDSPCSFPDSSRWSPLIYSSQVVQSVLREFSVHLHDGHSQPPHYFVL